MNSYLQKLSISESQNIHHEYRKGYDQHPKLFRTQGDNESGVH